MRFVIDTNVLISCFLKVESVPARAIRKAEGSGRLIFTEATLGELIAVITRDKFNRYTRPGYRSEFLNSIVEIADIVPVTRPIKACRDADDDKFLDAAVHGRATHLITGDADLLLLHPFMRVAILTPADFLAAI